MDNSACPRFNSDASADLQAGGLHFVPLLQPYQPLAAASPRSAKATAAWLPWILACVGWAVACCALGALLLSTGKSTPEFPVPPAAAVKLPVPLMVHLENIGDRRYDGATPAFPAGFSGTRGQARRLEGFAVLQDASPPLPPGVSIRYSVRFASGEEQAVQPMGAFAGSRGQSRALSGFTAWLEGPNAAQWRLKYYAHVQNIADTPVYESGHYCGTLQSDLRMEGMEMWLESR